MHEEQKFYDLNEPYVWVYDPTSTKTYIIGSLLILGAIAICLFPLWPSQVREGVYYLSLAGASFLGAILGLAVLKYVVYAVVWAVTFGSVHFWLLPNLTEDVGFFESFVPVYKCNCSSSSSSSSSSIKPSETSASVGARKKDDDLDKEIDNGGEKARDEEVEPEDDNNSSPSATSKKMAQSILSGSTVEITSVDDMEASTTTAHNVRRRRSSATNREDEGFELVDDDGDLTSK